MAVDPTGSTTQVVVGGYDRSAVHASPDDAKPVETQGGYGLTGVAATMDYGNNYAYLVGNGTIVRLDVLDLSPSSSDWYWKFNYSADLELPTDAAGRHLAVLSWVRATAIGP